MWAVTEEGAHELGMTQNPILLSEVHRVEGNLDCLSCFSCLYGTSHPDFDDGGLPVLPRHFCPFNKAAERRAGIPSMHFSSRIGKPSPKIINSRTNGRSLPLKCGETQRYGSVSCFGAFEQITCGHLTGWNHKLLESCFFAGQRSACHVAVSNFQSSSYSVGRSSLARTFAWVRCMGAYGRHWRNRFGSYLEQGVSEYGKACSSFEQSCGAESSRHSNASAASSRYSTGTFQER